MEKGLESLKVWQKAMDCVADMYHNILPLLPEEEKYSLTSQLRRALISIPANIAEGHGRYYFRESVRFCLISRGSIEEVKTYLHLAIRLGYFSKETIGQYIAKLEEIKRMLNGYIGYLRKNLEKDNSSYQIKDNSESYEIEIEPYDL